MELSSASLQIGGYAERLAAVIAGSVEPALIEPPHTYTTSDRPLYNPGTVPGEI
jgi:hypothetical protein